ncbi:MAG: ATP synthase F1 subunit gamma [Oscillospiraceae bacterium]|nr:ATP synthase F1 subunit gamma [Oscillospiraceae bacterium]
MATANMKAVKRRIKSVESTKQITKAMQLVASSKLRRAKEKADHVQPYFNTLYETMCDISSDKLVRSMFLSEQIRKTTLLIVIAGDRGLAGGFNHNVLKLATSRVMEIKESGREVKILAIGKKSIEYFEKRGYNVVKSYFGIFDNTPEEVLEEISRFVISHMKMQEIGSVELVYTTFVSTLTQEPMNIPVFPIETIPENVTAAKGVTVYEPSPEELFDSLVPLYLSGMIYSAIVDSYASELAARRNAMENATDNADEMISTLSLQYNRARQAQITQELTEIVSGSMRGN